MWQYILLLGLPLILQHSVSGHVVSLYTKNNRNNKRAFYMFWILLFFMVAFRHESIGNDTLNYKSIFHFVAESDWKSSLNRSAEWGYSLLNKLISLFTEDFRWLLIISAFLGIYFVAKTYIKYSEDAMLTIALFVTMSNFIMLFSGIRQAIAISLGMLAFEFTRNKKFIAFILIVLVAITVHTSAFMLIFMYPLYHIKLKRIHIIFVIPLLGIVWFFNQPIFKFLALILNRFTDYDAEITQTGSVTMLILFVIFAIFSYLIPDESKLDSDTIGLRNFLLLAVAIQMFAPLHTLAMRMNYYYIIFIPLLIPKIISCRSIRASQVAIFARHFMVVFFLAYFFITAPKDNLLHTFPYHFFWEAV